MGGLEPTLYRGSMWYTPILQEWYYQVEVLKLEVGGENLNLDCREVSHFIYFSPYMLGFFSFSMQHNWVWTNPAICFEGIREKPDYVTFPWRYFWKDWLGLFSPRLQRQTHCTEFPVKLMCERCVFMKAWGKRRLLLVLDWFLYAFCFQYNSDKAIVDSGTTLLRLPEKVFDAVVEAITQMSIVRPWLFIYPSH